MTRNDANKLAHEICGAIGRALDDAGVRDVSFSAPLPGTDVVFLRVSRADLKASDRINEKV